MVYIEDGLWQSLCCCREVHMLSSCRSPTVCCASRSLNRGCTLCPSLPARKSTRSWTGHEAAFCTWQNNT
eukprot:3415425-Rhodomonas_salina.1